MTTTDPKRESREPGYRGSLPTREDRLARPWIFTIAGIFVLVFVLSLAGVPSRFIPDPTPVPLPSVPAASASPSTSADPSAAASPSTSASLEISPSPSTSASLEISPSPSE